MEDLANQNELKLEILISTMNRTSLSFLGVMFPYSQLNQLNILIINQTEKGRELVSNSEKIKVINSYERGLSLSRNLAINNAFGDICLIADDDVEYLPNFNKIILDSFHRLKNPTIVLFKIQTFSGELCYKEYPSLSKIVNKQKSIKRCSSIEISFSRSHVVKNQISFNELFGLGSFFQFGEEYLFLKDILRKNLNIYFENSFIVKHVFLRSTSNVGNDDYIRTKAAIYYIDYNFLSYLVLVKLIIFILRKHIITMNLVVMKYMIGVSGIKIYKSHLDE